MLRPMSSKKLERAALYVRVSTEEQDLENQLPALRKMAAQRDHQIVHEFAEKMSGTKKARPALNAMKQAAHEGEYQVLYVWAIDRLGRTMSGIVETIQALDQVGVRVVSFQEPWLDMPSAVRPLLLSIFGWVAEQERTRLVERTNAGLDRARAQGKKLGRKPKNLDLDEVLRMRKALMSWEEIGITLNVNASTVQRLIYRSTDVPKSVREAVPRWDSGARAKGPTKPPRKKKQVATDVATDVAIDAPTAKQPRIRIRLV